MAIKAILFDFDGTLLNTNELILQSFYHVFEERNPGKYQKEDFLKYNGPSLYQSFNELTPGEEEEMIRRYRIFNDANHDRLVTHYDGVKEMIEQLHQKGIRMAIVSSKIHKNILRGLRVLNIEHLMECIVGADDVEHVKPHPEPIEKALQQLGIEKHEAIMVGDNSHDIEGGKNAGVLTAGVAWSIKGEAYLQALQPDYMLKHLSDLLTIVSE